MSLARTIDARLNPVFVKEIRQALRGAYFRNVFLLAVFGATALAILFWIRVAVVEADDPGLSFLQPLYAVLLVGVLGFVPFWAFNATHAEWDENAYDLLALTGIRPTQLVAGKLLSAMLLALLLESAFAPILTISLLMGGVDPLVLAAVIALSLALSVLLCVIAVVLSSLATQRNRRAAMMVALGVLSLYAVIGGSFLAFQLHREPALLQEPRTLVFIAWALVSALMLMAVGVTIAGINFAHPYENRSSGLRALLVGMCGLQLAAGYGISVLESDPAPLVFLALGSTSFATLVSLFLMTEAEQLSPRVRRQVPTNAFAATLATPFLPGGGRAIFLLLGILAAIWAVLASTSSSVAYAGWWVAYPWVYLALPSGIAALLGARGRGLHAARAATVTFAVLAIVGPPIVGLIAGERNEEVFLHLGNPLTAAAWILALSDIGPARGLPLSSPPLGSGWLVVAGLATLTLLINAPRMWNAVREVATARNENRALAGRRPATTAEEERTGAAAES